MIMNTYFITFTLVIFDIMKPRLYQYKNIIPSIKEQHQIQKKNRFEIIGIRFTIGGVVISACFALYSIYLAKKLSGQQTEIKNLDEIFIELKKQNATSSIELTELVKQSKSVMIQTDLAKRDYLLLKGQIDLNTLDKYISARKEFKDITDLEVDFQDINISLHTSNSSFIKDVSPTEQLAFFHSITALINKGLNNSYIISNSKIYSYWSIFADQTKTTLNSFSYSPPKNVIVIYGNGLTKEESLTRQFSQYKEYFYNFIKNGINPLLNTTLYKNDWEKRMKEANYGRTEKR